MNKSLFYLLICYLFFLSVKCTFGKSNVDSLRQLSLTDKLDSIKVRHLIEFAHELSFRNPDSAISTANEAIDLSNRNNWQYGLVNSYYTLGFVYYNTGDYTNAKKFYNKSLYELSLIEREKYNPLSLKLNQIKGEIFSGFGMVYCDEGNFMKSMDYYFKALLIQESVNSEKDLSDVYNNIAIVYSRAGDFAAALNYYFKALEIMEKLGDKNYIAGAKGNIGSLYAEMGEYSKSLEYLFQSLEINNQSGNKKLIASDLANIGVVYMYQKDYDNALKYFFKALEINQELGSKNRMAICYGNIGNVYKEQNNLTGSLEYYLKGLNLAQASGDIYSAAIYTANIGSVYLSQKKIKEAEQYLTSALMLSDSIGDIEGVKETNQSLYELHVLKGDYKKALKFYERAMSAKDSLFNEDKAKAVTRLEMNYDFEKKETAIKAEHDKKEALAKAEIRRQTVIRNSTFGGVGIAGFFTFLLVWLFNRKRQTAFEKQVSEVEMKALRAQMNPHFIFNSLSSIQNYVLNHDIKNSVLYINKFSKLMRLILENSRKQEVSLEKDLSALELYMQLEGLRTQNSFQFTIDVDTEINKETTLIPPMMLQPFVENSIIHGISSKENGMIKINIQKENNLIRCSVEDNGVGFNESIKIESNEKKKHESLAMKITQERLQIIYRLKKVKTAINIFNLKDDHNNIGGLRVELLLPLETAF